MERRRRRTGSQPTRRGAGHAAEVDYSKFDGIGDSGSEGEEARSERCHDVHGLRRFGLRIYNFVPVCHSACVYVCMHVCSVV